MCIFSIAKKHGFKKCSTCKAESTASDPPTLRACQQGASASTVPHGASAIEPQILKKPPEI